MPTVLAICIGASLGALARWQLSEWLNTSEAWLPWGTLAANLLGGYLVGVVIALLQQHPDISPLWRLFWITGVLGALTTFSSFSAEVVGMLSAQRWLQAFATMGLHLGGSLLMTVAGLRTVFWVASTP